MDIEINGEPVDLHMKLGDSGEAYFVEQLSHTDDDADDGYVDGYTSPNETHLGRSTHTSESSSVINSSTTSSQHSKHCDSNFKSPIGSPTASSPIDKDDSVLSKSLPDAKYLPEVVEKIEDVKTEDKENVPEVRIEQPEVNGKKPETVVFSMDSDHDNHHCDSNFSPSTLSNHSDNHDDDKDSKRRVVRRRKKSSKVKMPARLSEGDLLALNLDSENPKESSKESTKESSKESSKESKGQDTELHPFSDSEISIVTSSHSKMVSRSHKDQSHSYALDCKSDSEYEIYKASLDAEKQFEQKPEVKPKPNFRKVLTLKSDVIGSLNLKPNGNEIAFSVTTAFQGTTVSRSNIYLWKWSDKIIISDIDGTITRSDVLGHVLPYFGKDWAQAGVTQLFTNIESNGYKFLYLSARAIGQAKGTREYLRDLRQNDVGLPDGPLLLSPTSLISAFHR